MRGRQAKATPFFEVRAVEGKLSLRVLENGNVQIAMTDWIESDGAACRIELDTAGWAALMGLKETLRPFRPRDRRKKTTEVKP